MSSDSETTGTTTAPASSVRTRAWAVAGSLAAMLISAAVLIPMCGLGVMFTATCNPADDRLLCSPAGVPLLMGAPVAGLVAGIVLSLVGASLAHRRGHSLGVWLLAGWAVYAGGICFAILLTEQEQSPQSKAAETAAQQAEDERERADAVAERAARPNLDEATAYLHQLRGRLDADLSPTLGAGLAWTPPRDNTNCLHDGAPGANVVTTAALGEPDREHWPVVVETVTRLAGQQHMSPAPAEDTSAGEHRYIGNDGTQLSADPHHGRPQVWLSSDCRLTPADRAALGH